MTDVIFGANGMAGRALMQYVSDAVGTYHNGKDNFLPDRNYEWLDICMGHKVEEFFAKHNPKKVFIACANLYVDGCENPSSDAVNITGITRLIRCADSDALIVFFSSSYVFDGKSQTPYKPTDETFPINRYGRQKEEIERLLVQRGRSLIIRTTGIFGQEGTPKNFVDRVRRAVIENKRIVVPSDQTMNPVWSMDLAKVTVHLSNRYDGIWHVAGDKCVSKYEWAISIAYKLGCKKPHELIVGMKTIDMNQLANRPLNGCLDCNGLTAVAMTVPSLEKGLEKYLGEKK